MIPCDDHGAEAPEAPEAERMDDRHRAEAAWRQEQQNLSLAGKAYE
jgi:hypothetical protein